MQTITYITFNFPLEDFFQLSTLNSQLYPVIRSGFEPETHSLEGCCSIQLSYRTSLASELRTIRDLVAQLCLRSVLRSPHCNSPSYIGDPKFRSRHTKTVPNTAK